MRLLAKYNKVNIFATILVLLIGGFFYYEILKAVLLHQLDDDLKLEQQEYVDFVKENNHLPSAENYKNEQITWQKISKPIERKIYSLDIFDSSENEFDSKRILEFPIKFSGDFYKVSVAKSQQENDDLRKVIVWLTLGLVILLLAVLFIINRFVLNKLWYPFNDILKALHQFNLHSTTSLQLKESKIVEFKELNNAVTLMSDRVMNDFEALKSFTENASHEIQTPLAIINSKIELLIQSENFNEIQMLDIMSIQEGVTRLSKLNKSLLLMTKIDNHQFQKRETVNISEIIKQYLNNYEELISAKQITLHTNMEIPCIVLINEVMAQVLVSNLITNAIRHNYAKGDINILTTEKKLVISNTGAALNTEPERLFERFKKDKIDGESLGLGLAIVKKIAEHNGFNIQYSFFDSKHYLTVDFAEKL